METWLIIITRFVSFIWIHRFAVAILFVAITAGYSIRDRRRYIKVDRRFVKYG